MIKIRRLRIGEGELYKQVRLTALQEAPYAFTTTYESAVKRSPESWQAQADASAQGPDRATLLAFEGEAPIGMMALYRDANRTDRSENPDEGELIQVWVSPEYRGKGVADKLLEAMLGWAKENSFRRVVAGVNPGNEKALMFYRRYGFRPLKDGSGEVIANMFYKEIDLTLKRLK